MGLPVLLKKIFESDGYGPKLNRSVLPFSDSAASWSSTDVVSPGWVKQNIGTPIYVGPNGDDNNDGLTSGTAVASFTHALALAGNYAAGEGCYANIHALGGTYQNELAILHRDVILTLEGEITIPKLTVSASTLIVPNYAYSITIDYSGDSYALLINESAKAYFTCLIDIIHRRTAYASIGVQANSLAMFTKLVHCSSSFNINVCLDTGISNTFFYGGLSVNNSTNIKYYASGIVANQATIRISSYLYITADTGIYGAGNSSIFVSDVTDFGLSSSSRCIGMYYGACMVVNDTTMHFALSAGESFIRCSNGGRFITYSDSNKDVYMNGSITKCTCLANEGSLLYIVGYNIGGTVTNAGSGTVYRYESLSNSSLITRGGQTAIPGPAGSIGKTDTDGIYC